MPCCKVRLNGTPVAGLEVRSTNYTDYTLRLPAAVKVGDRIDVAYVNNGSSVGERRHRAPDRPGRHAGHWKRRGCLDGVNVTPGRSAILWNGALRFLAPDDNAPKVIVRARGSMAGNIGPLMTLFVAGTAVGSVEVRSPTFVDHVFTLSSAPASSTRVDVLFSNDGANSTEDRNLYIESLTVNGTALLPTNPGVVLDRGSGNAAFDGINVIAGRSDLLWNGALRLLAP